MNYEIGSGDTQLIIEHGNNSLQQCTPPFETPQECGRDTACV